MAEFIQLAHWGLRYLILTTGLAVLIGGAMAWRRPAAPGWLRPLAGVFVGTLDLQVLLGVGMLFVRAFYPALTGHLVTMVLAAAAAHVMSIRARRRAPGGGSTYAIGAAVTLLLVVAGLAAIGRPIV